MSTSDWMTNQKRIFGLKILNQKRSNKQWHECGDKPKLPVNGRDVKCSGAICAAVCPIGWRSQGRWKIKCQSDNTWSHSRFSPCVTCPDMSDELSEIADRGVTSQSIFRKNLPVTQFFCGNSSNWLGIKVNRIKFCPAPRIPGPTLSTVWFPQSTIVQTVHFHSNDVQFGSKRFTFA